MSLKTGGVPSHHPGSHDGVGHGDNLSMSSPTILCLHLQGRVQRKQPYGDVQWRRTFSDKDHMRQRAGGQNHGVSPVGEVHPPPVHHQGVHQHPPRPHLELQGQERPSCSLRELRWQSLWWKRERRRRNYCFRYRQFWFHEYKEAAEKVPNPKVAQIAAFMSFKLFWFEDEEPVA